MSEEFVTTDKEWVCRWCGTRQSRLINWQYLANEGWTFQMRAISQPAYNFCCEEHKDLWLASDRDPIRR